jgi:hypothetical protein
MPNYGGQYQQQNRTGASVIDQSIFQNWFRGQAHAANANAD